MLSPSKDPWTVDGSAGRDPKLVKICQEFIIQGKLSEAEKALLSYLETKKIASHDVLEGHSHLIRIAAEQRELEKMSAYVERVKKIPLKTKDDEMRFSWCLYATGNGWLYSGNTLKARENFENSLKIARQYSDSQMIFASQVAIIETFRTDGLYKEALEQLTELRKTLKHPLSDYMEGKILIIEGGVYRKQGSYHEAIHALEKARTIFSSNKNLGDYHYILWGIGTCYAALEDTEKAKIYLELAQHNADGVEFWRINVLSNLTLAELFTVTGNYSEADKYYDRIEKAVGPDETTYYGRRLMRGKTLLSIKKGDYSLANELIDRLVVLAVRERNQREIMRLRLLKAEVLLRSGEAAAHDEARAMLQEALAFYKENKLTRHLLVCLELLARLDSTSGYPGDALKKVDELLILAKNGEHDRLCVRAELAKMVLERKLGKRTPDETFAHVKLLINRLHLQAERVIFDRFNNSSYDAWTAELNRLDSHFQLYVNEFFEDFHFVPNQTTDIEIDQNTHYVREKHLGEIPFYNKFTLMRILCLLAETPGKEFSKEDLAREIWGQEYNPLRHDNNIYININRLRKLIEPNPRENRYIMNGSRGYYFNPSMKVNISTKIANVSPKPQGPKSEKEIEASI